MNSNFALKCDSISKTYKINHQNNLWALLFKKAEIFTALSNVSLEIKPGEIVGMIGKNGAGKSTLLKVLSGITFSTSGTIEIHGRIGTLLEVGTGFHPELTGRENIYLNGAILGMSRKEINRKIDEIIDFSEIEKFIDTPVKRYSSGMYTRLAFAVSASLESEILFVDEVLAVGDAAFQKKCLGKMGDISNSGRTIIFVSHNMGAIAQLCNRCIYLKDGKIVFDGLPKDSIEFYLDDYTSSSTAVFVRKEPSDKTIYINKIFLENEKQEKIAELEIFKKSRVIIEYTVKEKSKNVVIAMEISCNGQPILYSYDTDQSNDLKDTRDPGHYNAKIELPTPIFKEGDYTILLKIGHNHINISEDNIEIKFSIVNNFLNIDDKGYRKDRPGFLCSTLQWITTKQ